MKMTTIRNDRYQQDDVLSAIQSAGSVLLFGHVNPDGDTLGSLLALKLRLERMGKRVQAMVRFCAGISGFSARRGERAEHGSRTRNI